MASQNPHELDKDRTCTRCSQPFHSTAVTRDTMWPEPTINVTQRHLFCELKDLFWPPVLTEPWLQFEVLCCSSLTLRQPVSLYGICSSDKLMQECTWVCVVKNSPQIFFNFFFFVRMADGVYKCILPVGVRVCVWESICMLFPFVCYQNSFFCQPTGATFQEILSWFLCLFSAHGIVLYRIWTFDY